MKKIKLPKRITVPFLTQIGACEQEIIRFEKLWSHGCEVTRKNLLRALEEGLTPYYIMEEFLKYHGFITGKAWRSFYRAIMRLDQQYERAKQTAYENHAGGPLYEAAVLKARRKANGKEATLLMALWRKAKKEVAADGENSDGC